MRTTTATLLLLGLAMFVHDAAAQENVTYAIWGDPNAGRQVYAEKRCGQCHAINGVGPTIGPDLVRSPQTAHTITQLAGVMWNHAPLMHQASVETGIRWTPFKGSEMRDLIAYLAFLRLLDQSGNVDRGRRLFDEKRCSTCHALAGDQRGIGPDLSRWRQYGSPILWAEIMWQHASEMETKMGEMGLTWPTFRGNELVDLIAFIQAETRRRHGP